MCSERQMWRRRCPFRAYDKLKMKRITPLFGMFEDFDSSLQLNRDVDAWGRRRGAVVERAGSFERVRKDSIIFVKFSGLARYTGPIEDDYLWASSNTRVGENNSKIIKL